MKKLIFLPLLLIIATFSFAQVSTEEVIVTNELKKYEASSENPF